MPHVSVCMPSPVDRRNENMSLYTYVCSHACTNTVDRRNRGDEHAHASIRDSDRLLGSAGMPVFSNASTFVYIYVFIYAHEYEHASDQESSRHLGQCIHQMNAACH